MSWKPRTIRYVDGVVDSVDGHHPNTRRIIVLIHGFNNDVGQAGANYKKAATALEAMVGRSMTVHDWQQIWKFHWPGYVGALRGPSRDDLSISIRRRVSDSAGAEGNQALSAASYSAKVGLTPTVGAALADYLVAQLRQSTGVTQFREVCFIAHSLGCRVVLETLKRLAALQLSVADVVPAMCLMAAAVPVHLVEQASRGELSRVSADVRKNWVLYSRRDLALGWAFSPGQFPRDHRWSEAVGRFGRPVAHWRGRDDTGLRHKEYWGHPATMPHAVRLLGIASGRLDHLSGAPEFEPLPRDLPTTTLASNQVQAVVHVPCSGMPLDDF